MVQPTQIFFSSAVPSSSGEAGRKASDSEEERDVDALTSNLSKPTLAAQETPAPCINLKALHAFQQNEFFKPQTPLTWAVSKGKKDFVAWLLDHGARADEPDDTNKTPMSYAVDAKDLDSMEVLVKHGALPDSEQVRPNIYLITKPDTSTSFRATIEALLKEGENTQVGKRLLEKIGKGSHTTFITSGPIISVHLGNRRENQSGEGQSSLIIFSDKDAASYMTPDCTLVQYPPFAQLWHELIHAYHNSKGKDAGCGTKCDKMVWTSDEEYKTIMGFPSKNPARQTPKITENAILEASGRPPRMSHGNLGGPFALRREANAELYKSFCEKNHYMGQAHNPPPPMIHINQEYFRNSKSVALIYYASKDRSEANLIIEAPAHPVSISKDFVWENFPPDQCPSHYNLQYVNSRCYQNTRVYGMGIYRLSYAEARAAAYAAATERTYNCHARLFPLW